MCTAFFLMKISTNSYRTVIKKSLDMVCSFHSPSRMIEPENKVRKWYIASFCLKSPLTTRGH